MSVEVKRILPRLAGCCALVFFAGAFAPAPISSGAFAPSPHFESADEGVLCMDDMETEPYADGSELLPVHLDGGCSVSELPIST
jgi:hypothetical protein